MRNAHGYATIIMPEGPVQEMDTVTCVHCGHIDMTKSNLSGKLEVLVFRADGTHYLKECGFCRGCYEPVCPKCDGKPCNNRFRRMEFQEAAALKFACS